MRGVENLAEKWRLAKEIDPLGTLAAKSLCLLGILAVTATAVGRLDDKEAASATPADTPVLTGEAWLAQIAEQTHVDGEKGKVTITRSRNPGELEIVTLGCSNNHFTTTFASSRGEQSFNIESVASDADCDGNRLSQARLDLFRSQQASGNFFDVMPDMVLR